jgi:hypothetical protein
MYICMEEKRKNTDASKKGTASWLYLANKLSCEKIERMWNKHQYHNKYK